MESFQNHSEELLREEGSKENDYCIEELNVSEERQEDFLENMKDSVIIDDAIVEGVCIVNRLYEDIINDVLGQVGGKASTGVLNSTESRYRNLTEEKKNSIKYATESSVCNAIFRKGSTPNMTRLRKPSEIPKLTHKIKQESMEPSGEIMRNIQLTFQDKLQVKILKHEKEFVKTERKLEDANEKLRKKVEECEMHEREASSLKRTTQLLENDLDSTTARLESTNQNLSAITERADELQWRCQALESRLVTVEKKGIRLQSQFVSAKNAGEDFAKKCDEAARSMVMLESEVDKLQVQTGESNKRVKAQEEEIKNLMEMQTSTEVAVNRAELKEVDLMNKVKIANEKREAGEDTVEQKEREIQALSNKLKATEKLFEEKSKAFKTFHDEVQKKIEELLRY